MRTRILDDAKGEWKLDAERPPGAIVLCGSAGAVKCAVVLSRCSDDRYTQTPLREMILEVPWGGAGVIQGSCGSILTKIKKLHMGAG